MANRIRPVSPKSAPSFASRMLAPVLIAGSLLVAATVYTVINGELRLPFGGAVFSFGDNASAAAAPSKPAAGAVKVYASPRSLPAYTKITREHLWAEEGPFTIPVVEPMVAKGGLFREGQAGLQNLLGRVLKREKPRFYAFSENDFLPKGTRPGTNAGIPPGKRGVWVDVSKVTGLADLRTGDHIDLVAATADGKKASLDTDVLGNVADTVMKARLSAAASAASQGTTSSSWVVARGAQVIAPTRSRPVPGAAAKRGAGATLDEVFLAVAPNDVAQLSQALAQQVTLLAAPRSSQPTDAPVEIADQKPEDANAALRKLLLGDDDGAGSMQMVEVIRGGQRETVTVPRTTPSKGQR